MGLFDGKERRESAEREVLQKLSQVPLLNNLIDNILNADDEPWLQMQQNYYDNCKRIVTVEPDSFEIKWNSYHEEPVIGADGQRHTQRVEDIHGRIAYRYTLSGYVPLHSYRYENGAKEVSTERICYLFASIIHDRLKEKMPKCIFSEVDNKAVFTYSVPSLPFKDWF